jgi:hypothetical protein
VAVAEVGETYETGRLVRGRGHPGMLASRAVGLFFETDQFATANATRCAYAVSMYSRTAVMRPSRIVKTPMQKFS